MTTAGPAIRIISERVIQTRTGQAVPRRRASITYQIPPRPAATLLVDVDQIADLQYKVDNPDETDAPEAVRTQGDADRRDLILAHHANRSSSANRVI